MNNEKKQHGLEALAGRSTPFRLKPPVQHYSLFIIHYSLTMWHKVFVYGTLKSGQCNHSLLKGKRGYSAIAPQIDLHAGPHYPFAVRGLGQASGEMYEIDNLVLQQLDKLEGHPYDYKRELTTIILADGQTTEAWIYLNNKAPRYPLIPDGHWQTFLGG